MKKDRKESYSEQREKIKEVFYKLNKEHRLNFRIIFENEFGLNRLNEMFAKKPRYVWHEWHLKFFARHLFHCSLADMMEADFSFVPAKVFAKGRSIHTKQPKITQHSQASLFILAKKDNEKGNRGFERPETAEAQRD